MYFGRNTPEGYLNDESWDAFEDILSMTFSGYTVQDVQGVWKGEHEDTKLVTVSTKHKEKVEDIAKSYIDTFKQDSVGLLVSESMSFF